MKLKPGYNVILHMIQHNSESEENNPNSDNINEDVNLKINNNDNKDIRQSE